MLSLKSEKKWMMKTPPIPITNKQKNTNHGYGSMWTHIIHANGKFYYLNVDALIKITLSLMKCFDRDCLALLFIWTITLCMNNEHYMGNWKH